jgi:hypothetical protein
MAKTSAPAVMALVALNMGMILPVTVGVRPLVAGMGVAWYSVLGMAGGGAGVWWNQGNRQRPRCLTCGRRVIT